MNFDEVQAGYAFLGKHQDTAEQVMATSSLAETFAAKDIAPVLMETGRLPKDFQQRMHETGQWMDSLFDPPMNPQDFAKREYAKCVELGRLHASVADQVEKDLHWNAKVRVPVNRQAFAFVLYTFAWQPIETMIATKEVDPVKDEKGLAGWFHLWSVFGHGMGVPDDLLPTDFYKASRVIGFLRKAQYAAPGEPVPAGIPILLGGHVRMIAAQLARAHQKTPAEMTAPAAKALADSFSVSPGLSQSLGLGGDPAAKLLAYAKG